MIIDTINNSNITDTHDSNNSNTSNDDPNNANDDRCTRGLRAAVRPVHGLNISI